MSGAGRFTMQAFRAEDLALRVMFGSSGTAGGLSRAAVLVPLAQLALARLAPPAGPPAAF